MAKVINKSKTQAPARNADGIKQKKNHANFYTKPMKQIGNM